MLSFLTLIVIVVGSSPHRAALQLFIRLCFHLQIHRRDSSHGTTTSRREAAKFNGMSFHGCNRETAPSSASPNHRRYHPRAILPRRRRDNDPPCARKITARLILSAAIWITNFIAHFLFTFWTPKQSVRSRQELRLVHQNSCRPHCQQRFLRIFDRCGDAR